MGTAQRELSRKKAWCGVESGSVNVCDSGVTFTSNSSSYSDISE